MNNSLFTDTTTHHRIRRGNRSVTVYARTDWEGNFVRYVARYTPAEISKLVKSYGGAKVGILPTFEVQPWEIGC